MTMDGTQAREVPRIRRCGLAPTLLRYMAWTFVTRFLVLFGGIAAIVLLVTTIDQLDQLPTEADASLPAAFELALLRLPQLVQEVMPFAILFTAMASFWRMTRTNELVVARAAGVSAWQLLAPAIAVAMVIGVLTTTALNPVSSVMLQRFEQLEARYSGGEDSTLSVSETGLWLRQVDKAGRLVIHASRVRQADMTLFDVIVLRMTDGNDFASRIDAERAELADGQWVLRDAVVNTPGRDEKRRDRVTVPTELTPDKIYNSFAPPETISFWRLPEFIGLLENAGFAVAPHRLQFQRLLSTPFLFAGMVLLAAIFSLRQHRQGGVAFMTALGVVTGFGVFLLSNLVFAIGLAGSLPVIMAAWTPTAIILMLGAAGLLHLEDG